MHVISCAENESIEIAENITVTVLEIDEDSVRVGIRSPFGEQTYREETLYWEKNEAELLYN